MTVLVEPGHEILPQEMAGPILNLFNLANLHEWWLKCGRSRFRTELEVYKTGKKAGEEYGFELHTQLWVQGFKQDSNRHFSVTYWGKHKGDDIQWSCIARRLNGQIVQVSDAELKAFIKEED